MYIQNHNLGLVQIKITYPILSVVTMHFELDVTPNTKGGWRRQSCAGWI